MADGERLSWSDIRMRYPNQWVCLDAVKYIDNDMCNVESAIVICGISDDDYIKTRLEFIQEGKDYQYERTEDVSGFSGVII